MKASFFRSLLGAACLSLALTTPAFSAPIFLIGPVAEMGFVKTPENEGGPRQAGLLLGGYIGTSGLELRPQALISHGEYQGFLVDGGLRITPKWFGQGEYLFNMISPYAVIGGSWGWPNSWGYHGRLGLGVIAMGRASVNAEIGYRDHAFSESLKLEGVTLSARVTIPI